VLAGLVIALLLLCAPVHAADPTPAAEAERIVFLLQYVGTDYAAAVRDGQVVDEAEYRENRDFAMHVAERFASIRAGVPAAKREGLDRAIGDLVRLVETKGDPVAVKDAAETAIPTLIEVFGLRAFPRERPDPIRAARLFAENCTPCHGTNGNGDGPRAKDLDPPPAKFSDPARLDGTAPYVFYNAITLGVGDTAMASFADGLSDQERWDLAFHLWSLRIPPPSAAAPPVKISLRDLATRSSNELAPDVVRQAAAAGRTIDAEEAKRWIARLRADPPILSDSQERLARMRQDLAATIELVRKGQLDTAADRVTTAYLTEFEPLEPEIDRRDKSIRSDFERSLIDFRTALRGKDADGALRIAAKLSDAVDRADRLLSARPIPRAWKWLGALVVVTLVAVVAIVVSGRRSRTLAAVGRERDVG